MPPISGSLRAQGELAQMVERSLSMREVRGSMPRFSTTGFHQKHHFKKNRNKYKRGFLRIHEFVMRDCAIAHQNARFRNWFTTSKKRLSEVGFEPTPTFVDQNTPVRKSSTLESGALDRSAILTCGFGMKSKDLFARYRDDRYASIRTLSSLEFSRMLHNCVYVSSRN